MKYRLLALDLDGTLLNSQKEITPEVRKALAWAKERGVYVVLSTGRIVGEAAEFARELPCEDLMVTAGGTAIATASDERILQSWNMPCEIGAKAVEAVQSRPVRVMIYVGSKIYINEYSNRDFVANYRVEGFHANKIVTEDIAGEIRKNHLCVTKVYALGEREVLEQALAIPQEVDMGTAGKRLDLRDKLIFTIDGDDAKDFDDAVSLEKLENGHYLLGVHIADVSHYVTPDSPLDAEAFRRGTSVYFPGHVVPMLPFALSNGICSLNPKVDRLAFSALMEVDKDGRRYGAKFAKSVICSKARMTYNKVNNNYKTSTFWLEDGGFFKIQTVELGYELPVHRLGITSIRRMRVYLRGNNLCTVSKIKDVDPEAIGSGLTNYPLMRTFVAGVKLTF